MRDQADHSAFFAPSASGRRDDLDRAKGIAIVLVVFGHLVAREDPPGAGWYEPLRHAIYLFHMPFFLYLSGYVARLRGGDFRAGWGQLVRRRAVRLLVPFVMFGTGIVLGKRLLAGVLAVDHAPSSLGAGLLALVWDTAASPALSVWYLPVLFIYSIALPPLRRLDRGGTRIAFALAAVLFPLPAPPLFYLDRVCGFFVFFAAGVLAAGAGEVWLGAIDGRRWRMLAPFGGLLLAASLVPVSLAAYPFWRLAVGLMSMPALHALVRAPPLAGSRALLALGRFAFSIYLFNTICIGLAKGLLLRWLPWEGANFLLFAPLLLAAGILGPILVKQSLPRLSPSLDRITE